MLGSVSHHSTSTYVEIDVADKASGQGFIYNKEGKGNTLNNEISQIVYTTRKISVSVVEKK